jgi:hypothetical protein
MRLRTSALALLLLFTTHAWAQHNDPSQVSAAEVFAYKTGIDKGCRDTGHSKGDPAEKVDRLCGCVMSVLASRLTDDDWRRAVFYGQQGRIPDEQAVITQHFPAVQACVNR